MSVNVRTVTENLKTLKPLPYFLGFLILLFYQTCDAILTEVLQALFRSTEGTPHWVWPVAILSVILNLVGPLLVMYWILSRFKASVFFLKEFEQVVIEFVRAWGRTFHWTFAFILPGIWKWLSYTYVPFVVLFSKSYQRGEVDALELSEKLFRTQIGKTLLLVLGFSLVFPLLFSISFDGYRQIWNTPVITALAGFIEFSFLVLSSALGLHIYQKASAEVKDELIF